VNYPVKNHKYREYESILKSYLKHTQSQTLIMAFDPNQLGMAIFLLIAAFFNIWFVITSYRRAFFTPKAKASDIKSIVEVEPASRQSYQLLSNAVATMASFEHTLGVVMHDTMLE